MPSSEESSSPEAARPRRRRRVMSLIFPVLFGFWACLSLFLNASSVLFDDEKIVSMETIYETGIPSQSSVLNASSDYLKAGNDTTETKRKVEFLTESDFFGENEMYSGMWWQNRTVFLTDHFERITSSEGASFAAFNRQGQKPGGGVRLTRDWLDMMVEHLSKYVKHLDSHYNKQLAVRERLVEIMQNYIHNAVGYPTNEETEEELAVHSTIAILPLKAAAEEPENELIVLEMGATLVSLWKVGIGRAIVVGLSESEQKLAQDTFALLKEKLAIRPMELAYVQTVAATIEESLLVPRVALVGLQKVMESDNTDAAAQQAWLGSDPSRWKYVYFTEPDLILQTRLSALSAITQVLKEGKLMAAHRLELIPHQRDIPQIDDYRFVLPDTESFANITQLGINDVCCDQGKYYPANRDDTTTPESMNGVCPDFWLRCGFDRKDKDYKDPAVIVELHRRLLQYPFFSLPSGTGVPLVSEHQRMCVPRHGPANCDDG
jgi:hypothetical protein